MPGLELDGVLAATFCPIDGYATPEAAVQGYAAAASTLGASIVQGCTASRIVVDGGKVSGVETDQGTIATRRVVLAAGVWSRELGRSAGVDIPVEPEKRHVFFTEPGDPLPHELPLTIDFATGFYFHREGRGLLLGGRAETIEELAPVAVRRLPLLEEIPIRGGWWGYYEMSPDHNAIVGTTRDPEGLVYATGFSGHGFQQAPVIGEHIALVALDRPTPFDLTPFSLERFASGNDTNRAERDLKQAAEGGAQRPRRRRQAAKSSRRSRRIASRRRRRAAAAPEAPGREVQPAEPAYRQRDSGSRESEVSPPASGASPRQRTGSPRRRA